MVPTYLLPQHQEAESVSDALLSPLFWVLDSVGFGLLVAVLVLSAIKVGNWLQDTYGGFAVLFWIIFCVSSVVRFVFVYLVN